MKDIHKTLVKWKEKGNRAALVTVIKTWGSSPRQAGAHMVVNETGEFDGSVSGGCVESAVIQEAQMVIQTQKTRRVKFGVSNEAAWDVGLACGGEIEIFISPVKWTSITPILDMVERREPCWYQISLDEIGEISLITDEIFDNNFPYLESETSPEKLILYSPPDSEIIIIGGVNITQHLIDFSTLLGYKTTIIDPRKAFANQKRFPKADKILNLWPEDGFSQIKISRNTAIVILTHDDKIDIPAIKLALGSSAFYIGALGSKKTQARRNSALLDMGVAPEELDRIHGPIGLDIDARNPLEIALSIIAEITLTANKMVS
ncbi:MAG: XdhC family protein [Anaerolineales bacterium]